MAKQNVRYDIVIVGGGLVGAAMALALAGISKRYGLTIAIIDAAKVNQSTPTAAGALDDRATALALGSRNLLHKIGLWNSLAPYAEAITQINVSDQGQPFGSQMHARQEQQPALGYVVQNQHIGQVFWQRLQQDCAGQISMIDQANVTYIDNARVDSQLVYQQTQHDCQPNKGTENVTEVAVTCQLIIMADGGRSSLRDRLGIHCQQQSYHQIALVANVKLSRPHWGLACERFTTNGPMAMLPLPSEQPSEQGSHRAAIVWTQPIERQPELEKMESEQLLTLLQQQIGYRMGELQTVSNWQIYPLSLTVTQEQARQGLAVIGNAAHTVHPIAGQGFNLALRGAFALAEQTLYACKDKQAIGDLHYLNAFVQHQKRDQRRTVTASDQVMKLFSNQTSSLVLARQMGLLAMNQLPLIKTVFTRAAMGLDYPLANVLPIDTAINMASDTSIESSGATKS